MQRNCVAARGFVLDLIAEALTNVSKHAAASAARVTRRWVGAEFVGEIYDDGVGLADPTAGSGLAGLQARVEMLGGIVRIVSRPRSGDADMRVVPGGISWHSAPRRASARAAGSARYGAVPTAFGLSSA